MSTSTGHEWFIGSVVRIKEGAVPAGEDPDNAKEYADHWNQPYQITAGWHDRNDPGTSLQFEVSGWFWYGHDLELDRGF